MAKESRAEVSQSLNVLAKTSFIVLIGLGLSKVFSYVYRIIAARAFGPEVYGYFSLAIVASGFFIAVSTLGLSEGILRYIALYRGRKQTKKVSYLFRASTILLCLTSVIAGMLLFLFANSIAVNIFHDSNLTLFLQIFSLSVPITVIATPLLSGIRAYERISAYSGIYNIFQNLVKVILLAIFVYVGFGPQSISWAYIAGLGAVLIAAYVYAKKKIPDLFVSSRLDSGQKSQIISEVMKYSWPLLFYGILSTILYWIDSFSIGYYKDATSVGLYNAALPIAMLLGITSEVFSQLFLPMITRYYSTGKKKIIKEISKQVTKWVLAVNLPAFVIMFLFPGVLINLLFGSQYLAASYSLSILSIGILFSSLSFISLNLVSMSGRSKVFMTNIVIASLLNLVLNSVFVPMHKILFMDNSLGINGAAVATLISLIVFNGLFFIQAYRVTGIFTLRRKMLNVILAIVPSTLVALYVSFKMNNPSITDLIIMAVLFLVLYCVFLLAFRAFDIHDKAVLKKVSEKTVGLFKFIGI